MADLPNIVSDVFETVKDTAAQEAGAIAKSARGQVLPKKDKAGKNDQDLAKMRKKEKVQRQILLDKKLDELRSLRQKKQIAAPGIKLQIPSPVIPQLKRIEGWQTEVSRHRQEVGVSKGKG